MELTIENRKEFDFLRDYDGLDHVCDQLEVLLEAANSKIECLERRERLLEKSKNEAWNMAYGLMKERETGKGGYTRQDE